ncbi:MAG: 2,3-bisphosphoglycerate-independent phosphoglycerate mutase, partial [Lachnospiraceae bacterium]|nr:2,3-bisphosphoglycerate-independent phosphoglycerate mutase [Lachnospiraceae bacterium]
MSNTKILCILDGYGLAPASKTNAVAEANTPNLDNIFKTYNMVKANASGLNVGLPDGQMGNSEVGHLNIGSGRIVYQDLTKISLSIKDGSFFKNESLLKAIEHVKENTSSLHICGLLSDGGVHSHIEHLFGLLDMCKKENVKNVYLHPFLDGRDTDPTSGKGFLQDLQKKLGDIGLGEIVSICGRYYAMDRDN